MRKTLLALSLFLLTASLAACRSGTRSGPTEEPATPTQPPTGTSPPITPTQIAAATATTKPGCTVASLLPTPAPPESSPFLPIEADDWTLGSETAAVTIIEYSDFQ